MTTRCLVERRLVSAKEQLLKCNRTRRRAEKEVAEINQKLKKELDDQAIYTTKSLLSLGNFIKETLRGKARLNRPYRDCRDHNHPNDVVDLYTKKSKNRIQVWLPRVVDKRGQFFQITYWGGDDWAYSDIVKTKDPIAFLDFIENDLVKTISKIGW